MRASAPELPELHHKKPETSEEFRLRGITLVEIFLALGVVAILLSAASAPLERMSARIDLDIARDNILHTLHVAQKSAVRANVPVRVHLSRSAANHPPRLQLVAGFSSRRGELGLYPLPRYTVPENVRVTLPEGMTAIEYLAEGRPAMHGVITLSSESNPEYVLEIRVDDGPILRAPGSPQVHRALR